MEILVVCAAITEIQLPFIDTTFIAMTAYIGIRKVTESQNHKLARDGCHISALLLPDTPNPERSTFLAKQDEQRAQSEYRFEAQRFCLVKLKTQCLQY
jgi:hypothetical protein